MSEAPVQLWVLASPEAPHLSVLDAVRDEAVLRIGPDAAAFEGVPPPAVMLNCMGHSEVMRALWPRMDGVRWIHSLSAGVENVIIPELRDSPVPLTNSRGVFKRSLGEYVLAAMLYFAKDLARMRRQQAAGVWEPFDIEELHGRTLGIVGYGAIGQACAARARAFGMRVMGVRRRPEQSAGDSLVDRVLPVEGLPELLAEADYVVLTAPHTGTTAGMIGAAQLAGMKTTAVLINIGRGTLIDEPALVAALTEGRLRGAALDVFREEPLPREHPFYRLDNVLLSPHCADHTATWLHDATEFFVANFRRWRQGQPLENLVDKRAGY